MTQRKPTKCPFATPWLVLWLVIYGGILTAGLVAPRSLVTALFRLTGIFLCLIFALQYYRQDRLLVLALFFTLCADFILAADNLAASGVLVFAFAQLTHFCRLGSFTRFHRAYLLLAVVALTAALVLPPSVRLVMFGVVYALTLGFNLLMAAQWYQQTPGARSLAAFRGFALFVCCDLCVLTSFVSVIGIIPGYFQAVANYFAWVFYYPSQVLIGMSSRLITGQPETPAKKSGPVAGKSKHLATGIT